LTWTDLIIIIIVAVSAFIGYKKGLLYSLINNLAFIAIIFLSFLCRPFVVGILNRTSLPVHFNDAILTKITSSGLTTGNEISSKLELPAIISDYCSKHVSGWSEGTITGDVAVSISKELSSFLINVFAVIILLVLLSFFFIIIRIILKGFRELPVVGKIDGIGGLFFGVVSGLIFCLIIFMVLCLFSSNETLNPIVQNLNKSLFAKYFYYNNFITQLVSLI